MQAHTAPRPCSTQKRQSVCEVTKAVTYSQSGEPIDNGLADARFGDTGPGTDLEHPGYFGHIELASPVWHVGFLAQAYKISQCVCQHCSKLLCDTVRACAPSRPASRPPHAPCSAPEHQGGG